MERLGATSKARLSAVFACRLKLIRFFVRTTTNEDVKPAGKHALAAIYATEHSYADSYADSYASPPCN